MSRHTGTTFMIQPTEGWARRLPATVYRRSTVLIGHDGGDNRLVVLPADAAVFSPIPRTTTPELISEVVSQQLPTGQDDLDIWEVVINDVPVIGHALDKFGNWVSPQGAAWEQSGLVSHVRLSIGTPGGRMRADLQLDEHLSARDAVTSALRILAMSTRLSHAAMHALRQLLARQPITVPLSGRRVPVAATGSPTQVVVGAGEFIQWDLSRTRRAVFNFEMTSQSLGSVNTGERLATAEVFSAVDVFDDRFGVPPQARGLHTHTGRGGSWSMIPEAVVPVSAEGWSFTVPAEAHDLLVGPAIALSDSSHSMVVELAKPLPLGQVPEVLQRVSVGEHAIRSGAPTPATARPWMGVARANTVTAEAAVADPSSITVRLTPEELDEIVSDLLNVQKAGSVSSQSLARIHPQDRATVRLRKHGDQALAIAVIEKQLRLRAQQEHGDPAVLVAALTSYLCGVNLSMPQTLPWVRARVVGIVTAWLTRSPSRGTEAWLPSALTARTFSSDWEELASHGPWIRWVANEQADPATGIEVSDTAYVEFLAILRPHHYPLLSRARVSVRSPGQRWGSLFRPESQPFIPVEVASGLATALETTYFDPATAAARVQGVELMPSLAGAAERMLGDLIEAKPGHDAVLAVHLNDPDGDRIVVANLSAEGSLHVRVGDEPLSLAPNAVEQAGAAAYCSQPLDVDPDGELQTVDGPVLLTAEDPGLDSAPSFTWYSFPTDAFRGRAEQLARLRLPPEQQQNRVGSLIVGARRAGKSSLAWRVGDDPRVRTRLLLDLGDTSTTVRDFAGWNRSICTSLRRLARADLGIDLDVSSGDLVEALAELDLAVGPGLPVVLVLDEIDVLLVPEQGADGRRTAGRLGNMAFRNLVVIGTAQRFHRSTHEFKTWQLVDCPADLRWRDGLTYFFDPLHRTALGPRVERLRLSAATPQTFHREIVPRTGLRPYFWGQLRSRMEAEMRSGDGRRLIPAERLRAMLDQMVKEDPHLTSIFVPSDGMDPAEVQRLDLFSDDERRIAVRFALLPPGRSSISRNEAIANGGEEGLRNLLDRAYLLEVRDGAEVEIAAPIYHEFLRARATELIDMTPDANISPQRQNPDATSGPSAERAIFTKDDLASMRAILDALLRSGVPRNVLEIKDELRPLVPRHNMADWMGHKRFTTFFQQVFPEYEISDTAIRDPHAPVGEGASDQSSTGLLLGIGSARAFDPDMCRMTLRRVMPNNEPATLAFLATALRHLVPGVDDRPWDSFAYFTEWVGEHLPQYVVEGRSIRRTGAAVLGPASAHNLPPLMSPSRIQLVSSADLLINILDASDAPMSRVDAILHLKRPQMISRKRGRVQANKAFALIGMLSPDIRLVDHPLGPMIYDPSRHELPPHPDQSSGSTMTPSAEATPNSADLAGLAGLTYTPNPAETPADTR